MKRVHVLGVLAVLLAACSSTPRFEYMKEGATPEQRLDALSECQYQIRLNKIPAAEQDALLKLCMQGKGYRLKETD